VGVVNGLAWPDMPVARGLYRLRVLNAANLSTWHLYFSNLMTFWVIGTDGGLLDAPVATTSLRLSPAERVDLLVDFSTLDPGATVILCNDEPVPMQAAAIGEVPLPYLMRFTVGAAAGFRGPVPATLRGGPAQPAALPPLPTPQRVRNLTINQLLALRDPPALMTLNNLRFDTADIETPRQGTVEQWNLINTTGDVHPIHLHLVTFRILSRQPFDTTLYQLANPAPPVGLRWSPTAEAFTTGAPTAPQPWEAGWKDTVRVEGNTITRIIVRFPTAAELGFDPDATFGNPTSPLRGYVWHCHVIDHEDNDMMLPYRLTA
jgi:spore coat protein A, manganese oxidase